MKTVRLRQTVVVAVLFAGCLLVGCAGNPVVKAKSAGITTVTVEPRVGIRRPLQYGVKSQQGGLVGAITATIVTGMYKGKSLTVAELMQESGIDVSQLVHERFVKELTALNQLRITTNNAQGTFLLRLEQHGFDTPPFTSRPIPFVELHAELVDGTGRRIWQATSGLIGLGRGRPDGASWEEYRNDPQRLRQAWDTQATRAVRTLLHSDQPSDSPAPVAKAAVNAAP
jgi:hypothetical protein